MPIREFANEFSWSKSRHGKFETCRRLYWFHYYGAWGGWKNDCDPEIRRIYVLKNLSSRQQWAGKVVHDSVAFALAMTRSGETPPLANLIERARDRMRNEFLLSRRGAYKLNPKRNIGLIEHELQEQISSDEWKANWNTVEACLTSFYSSSWLEIAKALPAEAWLPIDEISSFELDGIRVFAGPDFAFRQNRGVVIVDWKTGQQREEDIEQVQAYSLFAQATWNCSTDSVLAKLVYLSLQSEVDVRVDEAALDRFRHGFRQSVAGMQSLLRDKRTNLAKKEDFSMTDEVIRCQTCAFRVVCSRG